MGIGELHVTHVYKLKIKNNLKCVHYSKGFFSKFSFFGPTGLFKVAFLSALSYFFKGQNHALHTTDCQVDLQCMRGKGEGGGMRVGATMPPMLFGAGEVNLKVWALSWKGNIYITYKKYHI